MRPLQTTDNATIWRWAKRYKDQGPSKKNTEQCFGIGIYQLGQARRWRNEALTVGESAANAYLWFCQTAYKLGIKPHEHLAPDIMSEDGDFRGWELVFDLIASAQQQVTYGAYSDFSGRNSRFDREKTERLFASLLRECVALMQPHVREESFYQASNIMLGKG